MLLAAVAGFGGTAHAQDDGPDLSFLEYLGSWQEGDEEWLIVADLEQEPEDKEEPEDKDEASAEDEDTDETEQK
jgi:hypothetical protein